MEGYLTFQWGWVFFRWGTSFLSGGGGGVPHWGVSVSMGVEVSKNIVEWGALI